MGQQIAVDLRRTIHHYIPDLYERLQRITDPRKICDYSITEVLLAGLFMFMLKQDSRNAMNSDRAEKTFAENYQKIFGKRLPHMDTVNDVLIAVGNGELELLKASLVASLIERKIFGKFKLFGQYHRVAVDATGVMAVNEGHCEHCLHKTSRNGVKSYFHNVLEAKLVAPNGFAISLATVWIENPTNYDKQDCELKAFRRLAKQLKQFFPRLPICIHADGLYPNKPFFDLCKENNWRFIVTLKDDSLKSLWEDIDAELLVNHQNQRRVASAKIEQNFRWLNGLNYQDTKLSWLECQETQQKQSNRFVVVSDLPVDYHCVAELSESGRLRFKIENEGFNTLKNLGYNFSHKFSRKSNIAMKNYMSLMHIAHMFNQLYELSSLAARHIQRKVTIKYLWKRLLSTLLEITLEVVSLDEPPFQIRYD